MHNTTIDKMKARSKLVNKQVISNHYQYPLNVAAERLGMCPTNLKKRCRELGVCRWPYRKVFYTVLELKFLF